MIAKYPLLSFMGPWSTSLVESMALNNTSCQSSVDYISKKVSIELKMLSKLAGGVIQFYPPFKQASLVSNPVSEHTESRPWSICMPKMLKIYINSTSRHKAQVRSGIEVSKLSIVFRKAGAYASLKGRKARNTLVIPTVSNIYFISSLFFPDLLSKSESVIDKMIVSTRKKSTQLIKCRK